MNNIKKGNTSKALHVSLIVSILAILAIGSFLIARGQTETSTIQPTSSGVSDIVQPSPEVSVESGSTPSNVCPEFNAQECEADWKSLTCQEIVRKLEKQNPGCFTDRILAGPLRDMQLRGKVVDANTGVGIAGIKIQAWSSEIEDAFDEIMTQKDGSFTVPVFKGSWQLSPLLEDSGYLYLGDDIVVPVSQKPGEPEVVIKLHVNFALSGKVVHPAHRSSKTPYSLTLSNENGETYSFELEANGGEFKVDGIVKGKYTVNLWNENPALVLPEPLSIEISEKTVTNKTFVLQPFMVKQAVDKINGRVFNIQDKNGVPNVRIVAQSQSSRNVQVEAKTDKNGNYQLTVFPGSWIVWPDFAERKDIIQGSDSLQITVVAGIPAVADFPVLTADATVKGLVSLDDVAPIEELSAYVEFHPEDPNLPVLGTNVEGGQFSLQLPAATYGVWLYLPSGSKYALTPIQPLQQVTLEPGGTKSLIIAVKERDAVIAGTLKDQKGNIIKGVPVTIYAETAGITEETQVDPGTGRYSLRVYSGVYRTWTMSYALGETDRKLLSDQKANFALPIAANSHVTQDIVLYEANAAISGKVYDADGKPFADVTVGYVNIDAEGNPFDPNTAYFEGWTTTGQDGNYKLFLPTGTYRLSVHQEGLINPPDQVIKASQDISAKADFRFASIEAAISGALRINGKSVQGWVSGWSDGGASVGTGTSAGGQFVFHVSRDLWHLSAATTIGNKYYVSDEIIVDTRQELSKTVVIDLRLELEYSLPSPIIKTFDASALTVLTLDDGTKITIPAGAISANGKLTVVASPNVFLQVEQDAKPIGLGYDIQARNAGGKNVTKFLSDVYIAIPYTDAQLQLYGLTEKDLTPAYWGEKAGTWLPVKNVSIDHENKYIVIATNHFTKFALVVAKPIKKVAGIPPIAVRQVSQQKLVQALAETKSPISRLATRSGLSLLAVAIIFGIIIIIIIIIALRLLRRKLPPMS